MSGLFPIFPLGGEVAHGPILGGIGRLQTIPIDQLRIDGTYQRAVSIGSVRNIRKICKDFDWSKFLPVIVVRQGDIYSVIDGQHRTTAASTIGIKEVPCYILDCSHEAAAAAFVAINGSVTPVSPIDIWFAEIAASDQKASRLLQVFDAAGVRVVRQKEGFKVGDTRSINVLRRAYDFYGSSTLITILQCITECGDGNPGMIVGSVVNGIGRSIRTKPDLLANPTRIFDVFDDCAISELLHAARIEHARTKNPMQNILTRDFNRLFKANQVGKLRSVG